MLYNMRTASVDELLFVADFGSVSERQRANRMLMTHAYELPIMWFTDKERYWRTKQQNNYLQ